MLSDRTEPVEAFMTREQAAAHLNVTVRTIDRYIARGTLPKHTLPIGKRIRIPRDAVNSLLLMSTEGDEGR